MPRRILEGNVVSDKMDKTVTVLVERRYKHPMYGKYVKRTDKFAAHDEANAFATGDRVQIQECRPISKRKTWTVITPASEGTGKPVAKAAPKKEEAKKEAPKEEAKAEAKKAAPKKEAAKKETAKKAPAKKATSKKKDEDK